MDALHKFNSIINSLVIKHGKFDCEIPEMLMSINYLKGHEKVLEIGGNIGRNSLVISHILDDDSNLVVLESDKIIAEQLMENKEMNNANFHIESCALSKRKLIQKGWDSKPSEELEDGYKWVDIINFEELNEKYKIKFDTLILDCEGAFYYILKDTPELLDNINLIIMENDYWVDPSHKTFIDSILKKNFYRDYSESGETVGVDKNYPFCDSFFEVWKRNQ